MVQDLATCFLNIIKHILSFSFLRSKPWDIFIYFLLFAFLLLKLFYLRSSLSNSLVLIRVPKVLVCLLWNFFLFFFRAMSFNCQCLDILIYGFELQELLSWSLHGLRLVIPSYFEFGCPFTTYIVYLITLKECHLSLILPCHIRPTRVIYIVAQSNL